MDYWFFGQLRRYRSQIVRVFSDFKVKFGDGGPTDTSELRKVTCRWGDTSRVAQTIVSGNSENKILSTPFITCTFSNFAMAPQRRAEPQFVRTVQMVERQYDEEQKRYTSEPGNRFRIDEYMPIPYDITVKVDMWTSNMNQKEQLFEQIAPLFNSIIDLQTSNNPLDWTVLTTLEMIDPIEWTSRTVPIGTENPIDVMTLNFKLPVWINPPAKVKKLAWITEIITNIGQRTKEFEEVDYDPDDLFSRQVTTPHDAHIKIDIIGGTDYAIYLCNEDGSQIDHHHFPSIVTSVPNPILTPGMSFIWNGITCTINHTNYVDAINDIRQSLVGTKQNCILFNHNEIQFVLNGGGDNTFVEVIPGTLSALGIQETTYPGIDIAWWRLLQLYGNVNTYEKFGINASQLRLVTQEDLSQSASDIIGWIDFDPINQNKLIWHADLQSFPGLTLPNINAIINPQESGPGINLSLPQIGQRYLLTHAASVESEAWGLMSGLENDIIEWTGEIWQVVFEANCNINTTHYILNLRSNKYFIWKGEFWSPVINHKYKQGYWKLAL